jgi:hypothetical protein
MEQAQSNVQSLVQCLLDTGLFLRGAIRKYGLTVLLFKELISKNVARELITKPLTMKTSHSSS